MSLSGAQSVEAVGRHCVRYGLVLVLLWIGGMKFTVYEAEGISGFVTNSPLMSWVIRCSALRLLLLARRHGNRDRLAYRRSTVGPRSLVGSDWPWSCS